MCAEQLFSFAALSGPPCQMVTAKPYQLRAKLWSELALSVAVSQFLCVGAAEAGLSFLCMWVDM